jgi:hypothetical protein
MTQEQKVIRAKVGVLAGHKSSSDTHHDEEPVVRSSTYFYSVFTAHQMRRAAKRMSPRPDSALPLAVCLCLA